MKTILIDVNAVLKTAGCLSDDPTRYALSHHYLEKNKVVTTNGRAMMIHEAQNELDEPIAIKLPVKEIKKACCKGKSAWLAKIPFEFEDHAESGFLSLPGMKVVCDIGYDFPEYSRVIPKYENATPCQFAIDPEILSQFGEPVYLMATGENNPLLVYPFSGRTWLGIIMPMRHDTIKDTKETYERLTGRTINELEVIKEAI